MILKKTKKLHAEIILRKMKQNSNEKDSMLNETNFINDRINLNR